jgi:hypothetical protein
MTNKKIFKNTVFILALSMSQVGLAASDRKSPNYQKYLENEEYVGGRRKLMSGVATTSVVGSLGLGILTVGAIQNTCAGAFGESKEECRANAEEVMRNGILITVIGLAIGIPLIVVGQTQLRKARREIDEANKDKKGFVYDEQIGGADRFWYAADARKNKARVALFNEQSFTLPALNIAF